MKKGVMSKMKFFIIAALVILVAGMALLGVFGLNQTVDYADGYELQVSVDQDASESAKIVKDATDAYLSDKGIDAACGTAQEMDDGKTIVYKFNTDVTADLAGLQETLRAKLDAESLSIVNVTVGVYQLKNDVEFNVWWIILALGIAIVAAFIYVLIMEKLAASVATLCTTLLSALTFVALMAITRLPANPFFGINLAVSILVGAGLSIMTLRRCKEELKNTSNQKLSVKEVADKVSVIEILRYVMVVAAIALAGVALIGFALPYAMYAGAQLIVAGVSAAFSSYFMTPLVWSAIKSGKNK